MTEPTPPSREEAPRTVPETSGDNQMHPAARLLFGWIDGPRAGRWVLPVIALLSLALLAADLFIRREAYLAMADTAAFFGLFGLAAVIVAVLLSWPARHLLGRREGYYGEDSPGGDAAETEAGA